MNWITRCPECATVYQVLPDQLEVAKGWLRCGQCRHVFDSTGLILSWSVSAPPRLDIGDLLKQEDRSTLDVRTQASEDLSSFEKALSSFQPEIDKAIVRMAASPPQSQDPADDLDVSTIDETTSRESVSRRWPSILALSALALALLSQVIWVNRFALVAKFPVMGHHVQRICNAWACESAHARDLHAVVIDTSSFIQRDDAFELQWVVRNTSAQNVLMTALEVTLEDVQGKPLVRRVFGADQLDAPETLSPGQVWQGLMRLTVARDLAVTGYRIVSFYP